MSSPIAGNESFSTVENIVGQIDTVTSSEVIAVDLLAQTSTDEDLATVGNLTPSLVVGSATDIADGATDQTLAADHFYMSAQVGTAPANYILPSATAGDLIVIQFSTEMDDAQPLTISCGTGDVFKTGSTLLTVDSAAVTVVQSTTGNNTLTYTPTGAVTDIINQYSKLYFTCTEAGVWRISATQNSINDSTPTGEVAFTTV